MKVLESVRRTDISFHLGAAHFISGTVGFDENFELRSERVNGKGLLHMQEGFKCHFLYVSHTLNGVVLLKTLVSRKKAGSQ